MGQGGLRLGCCYKFYFFLDQQEIDRMRFTYFILLVCVANLQR
jgi:hypothetical protein